MSPGRPSRSRRATAAGTGTGFAVRSPCVKGAITPHLTPPGVNLGHERPAGCQARRNRPPGGRAPPRRDAPPLRLQTLHRSPCTRPQHPELLANSQVVPLRDSCIAAGTVAPEEPGIRWPSLCTWPRRPRGEAEPYHPFARRAGSVARGTHWAELAMRRGDTMSRTTRRPPTSGTKTRQPARRAVATLAGAFLFGLAASEARAGIAFVQNLGTQKATSTGVTIAITVPAGRGAAGHSILLTLAGAD